MGTVWRLYLGVQDSSEGIITPLTHATTHSMSFLGERGGVHRRESMTKYQIRYARGGVQSKIQGTLIHTVEKRETTCNI